MKKVFGLCVIAGLATNAMAQIGSPNDAYVYGDGSDAVYQVKLNGFFEGVFSNTGGANTHGVFGGPNNNFLAGGFSGVKEINGNTGAVLRTLGSGTTYDVQFANNGNIYRSTGAGTIEELDYASGTYVRDVVTGIGGFAAFCIRQTKMYTVDNKNSWFDGTIISERDAVSGAVLQSWNVGHDAIQAVRFDSFGNFYFASMYNTQNGIFKMDLGTGAVSLFADNNVPGGGPTGWPGCHGFNFGPDGNLYCAMAGGTLAKYNGQTGAFLGIIWSTNDKLSDVVFKPVPTPAGLAVLGLGGLVARRRRR